MAQHNILGQQGEDAACYYKAPLSSPRSGPVQIITCKEQ